MLSECFCYYYDILNCFKVEVRGFFQFHWEIRVPLSLLFFISDFSFKFLRPSWWPCDFSPLTVVFTALWPLITHWLVHLYLQRKRRWEKVPHILRKWLFLFYDHNKTQLKFSFCFSPHSKIPWIVYYYWQLSTSIKEDELWMKTMHFLGGFVAFLS